MRANFEKGKLHRPPSYMDKNKILFIVLFFIIAGLFLYSPSFRETKVKVEKIIKLSLSYIQKENRFSPAQIYLPSDELKQSDTFLIKISGPLSEGKITGEFDLKKIDFFQTAEIPPQEGEALPIKLSGKAAILGIDVNEKPGEHILIINFSNGEKIERKINTIKTEFPTTELLITKELKEKGYTDSKIIDNIQGKENLILKKIIGVYTDEAYFNKAFINPLKNIKIVGAFGIVKKTGSSTVQHLGVDLDAKIGTPVFASNDGLVSFSQELPDYGKTLIIDHGLGIFSLYLHLDKFEVSEGEKVTQGQIIGLSGNTGYSIAPHLHFSIKINEANVDPLIFLEITKSY
jgi:hypothetical protein